MITQTDIDIDVADRSELLQHIKHIRAYGDKDGVHKVGVYIQNIPYDPSKDAAAIDFKEAGEFGFFKFDILNNSVYEGIETENDLIDAMSEPDWSLFRDDTIVKRLAHIHDYSGLVRKMNPTSVEELAMVLALIRPAKKHLIGKGWDDIKDDIWTKPSDGSYYFKKAHAVAFAVSIVVQLNILVQNDAN